MTQIAYESGRAFVFENYVWAVSSYGLQLLSNDRLIIPLDSALSL